MKKGDWVLILLVGALALSGWAVTKLFLGSADERTVTIKSEGKVTTELQIDATTSASYTVENQYGTNVIWVREGIVEMHEASCKNQLCVHAGPIEQPGQSIVCLPNRVVVEIQGKREDGVDAISK